MMAKNKQFVKELISLMEKYDVEMYIEIDQDYAGVQGAELRFDTKYTYSNLIFTRWGRGVNADMVRLETS